jgi:alkylation response protein AidB-like acyl-CoA dehydrogenase
VIFKHDEVAWETIGAWDGVGMRGNCSVPMIFNCAEVGVRVTAELMTMFGGTAFAGRLPFERYFRDARAGLVMGVANDAAYDTIGTLLFPAPASDVEPSRAPTS